jgi:hypothetical protein
MIPRVCLLEQVQFVHPYVRCGERNGDGVRLHPRERDRRTQTTGHVQEHPDCPSLRQRASLQSTEPKSAGGGAPLHSSVSVRRRATGRACGRLLWGPPRQ